MIGTLEQQAVLAVLQSPILTHGPKVKEFETAFAHFTGARHAIAVGSCTAAMHLAYLHLGLKPDDEVIVPAQSHVATAHAVELAGGRCAFVDAEPDTGNLDLGALESAITPRTRAIAVVHFLGMPVDMRRVMEIARRHSLFVVEDCALAIGSYLDNIHAGLWGDVGCFSFYPVKHITTAEGGMLITHDPNIAKHVSRLRAFGIDRHVVTERPVPGMYDAVELGLNYRLSEIGAALGLVQMTRVSAFLKQRRSNYQHLASALHEIDELRLFESSRDQFTSSHYCMSVMLTGSLQSRRLELMAELNRLGVGTSIYYPRPIPMMTYYQERYGISPESVPNATAISAHSIALPVGPHLGLDDMNYIVRCIKKSITKVS